VTTLPDTTTEQGRVEASVMLARLCGWLTTDNAFHNYRPPGSEGGSVNHKKGYPAISIFKPIPNGLGCRTLYDPANMALAWRVLNWAVKTVDQKKEQAMNGGGMDSWMYWHEGHFELRGIMLSGQELPPAEAQHAWLDKILQLAIEAGMI